jgi:hypothetical protein
VSLRHQILLDSPLAYWPLGDLSGTTDRDHSGNGRDLTWGTAPTVEQTLAPGVPGGVNLNGDREASIADAAWMDQSTFVVEFWMKTTYTTAALITPVTRRATNSAFGIYLDPPTNNLRALATTSVPVERSIQPSPALSVNDGALHHVVLHISGSPMVTELYVDAVVKASDTAASGGYVNVSEPIRVAGENASRQWVGSLAHVACYSALSATRIRVHYEAGIRSGVVPG